MSHFSNEEDQTKAESSCRMWAEPQPGPSRHQPCRQGYCGYCRVLYSNLDQHLSSLKHLDSVHASSRGSSTISSSSSSKTKQTLLERFLHDVLQYHPHRYKDPWPSHADLPSVSAPPLPREELDVVCFSDSCSRGTRERLSSSGNASCQLTYPEDDQQSNSREGVTEGAIQERQCWRLEETTPPQTQTPPTKHRKAHRKTNRRKISDPSSSPPLKGPDLSPLLPSDLRPWLRTHSGPFSDLDPQVPSEMRPWLTRQKQRTEALFSDPSHPLDTLDQTIEAVIQRCCHGMSSTSWQQEESEIFTLPVYTDSASDDWDSAVQVALQTPVQANQMEEKDLSRLMDTQVDLEDQVYSYQLESTLHNKRLADGGARHDDGFWNLPIEDVLPAPEHIPESFRGKTWAQIEQEDEEKVENLVQQFRRERFICYFDSESLARFGRRSQNKGPRDNKQGKPDTGVLPLLGCDEDDITYVRTSRKRQAFRVASRCQVVKVSHSTQTVQLVIPAVRQSASEAPPTSIPTANQDPADRTPDVQMWRCLPRSYSNIITPLQPRTSVVYLLCSPSGPTNTPATGSTPKRCRKKRRPLDLHRLTVKYKQLPVRFYDPSSNRILKNPPKGLLWHHRSPSSSLPPPCVRQLFRNLSPDLNTDRPQAEGEESSRVRGHSLLLSSFSRDSAQTDKQVKVSRQDRTTRAQPHSASSRAEQGREVPRERAHPPSKKRFRAPVIPLRPRREGLRRPGTCRKNPDPEGPRHCPQPRRGRTRRGRGYKRS